ncbi:MAG: SdpI family protein [Rhodothermaceae bacterium]|nr:SdpI family protein [Rhodothermaceae bacterium]
MTSFLKTLIKDWPALLILITPFVLIAAYWNQIPDEIPMHWNINGEVDRWGEKGFDVFFLPLASLGAYLLMLAVPHIDPKRKAKSQQKGIRAFRHIIPFLLTGLFLVIFAQWMGLDFELGKGIGVVLSVFFIAIGNYLQSVKPNYFIGIRTPWTLESEDIWKKTHRLGGRIWMIGGLVLLIASVFFGERLFFWFLSFGVFFFAFVPIGYSFYLYMQSKKETRASSDAS